MFAQVSGLSRPLRRRDAGTGPGPRVITVSDAGGIPVPVTDGDGDRRVDLPRGMAYGVFSGRVADRARVLGHR